MSSGGRPARGTGARIAGAARRLPAEQGRDRVTMKQVAREAGVARGFIHHYLSGQEEILLEVLTNASREYLAETERLAESLPEGRSFAVAALAETKARASRMPERYR